MTGAPSIRRLDPADQHRPHSLKAALTRIENPDGREREASRHERDLDRRENVGVGNAITASFSR
jgi:hypothetical protein